MWCALAVVVAGCANVRQPVATNLADSKSMTARLERQPFRDDVLTFSDPATGETFTGRIPGSKPQIGLTLGGGQTTHFSGMASDGTLLSGTASSSAPMFTPSAPTDSTGLLRGDKGGTLVCRFYLQSENALCVKPNGGLVYVDF